MSLAFGEIRQERHDCYAVFYEGGPGIECRRYDKQFPTFDEAWEWVRAKHREVMTPKVKRPVEPVYVSELDDLAVALPGNPHIGGGFDGFLAEEGLSGQVMASAAAKLAGEPNAPEAPEAAETATGDRAGSAEARGLSDENGWVSAGPVGPVSVLGSVPTGTLGRDVPEVLAKRRGRPPKVSA